MAEFSKGGHLSGRGEVSISLLPGPRREAIDPGLFTSYADECYLNPDGVCIRDDEWHKGVPISDGDRWWVCPVHD